MSASSCAPTIRARAAASPCSRLINRKAEGPRRWSSGHHPARRVRDRALLRRQHDHAGDLGAVGGRGPDRGRARLPAVRASRSRSASWSACSRSSRTAPPGSAPCSARSCWSISSTIAVLGVIQIVDAPEILLGAQSAGTRSSSSSTDGCSAFLALGSVVLAVTGAEALYADMGHFGRKPIRRRPGCSSCCPP